MHHYIIYNVRIVNEGEIRTGYVHIRNGLIDSTGEGIPAQFPAGAERIDAKGAYLLPGVIDDQVHFREPGLIHKGDIASESAAAAAGGVTSYMEMPNTNPQTISIEALEKKYETASRNSYVNYAFYLGATNDNLSEIRKADPRITPGIKVFMGASTGNMLVDNIESLRGIFAESPVLIATHCEDETMIRANAAHYREKCGEDIPVHFHPVIRSSEACYKSSSLAVSLADQYQSRLHILHISTAKELELFSSNIKRTDKKLTAEVCVHHLWFNNKAYSVKGNLIKWNPAIKSEEDRKALLDGLLTGKLDVVATDHAPHTLLEKENKYFHAPSGAPMVQHSLIVMMEFVSMGIMSAPFVADKMCHAPADLFKTDRRGYIRQGYHADLVLVEEVPAYEVRREDLLYKCRWSPLEGQTFSHRVFATFVNGVPVFMNGELTGKKSASPLVFNR